LPVRGDDGAIVKWIGTATDIEDRTRSEAELRRSHAESARALNLLEMLQSTAPIGFGFIDCDYRIVRMNDRLAAVNGSSAREQLGRTVSDVIPDIWPQLEPVYRRALEHGEPTLNLEVTGPTAEEPSRTHTWLTSYYPVRVGSEIVGVGVVVVDITERKEAERAQRDLTRAAIAAISRTVEARDPYTAGHQERVAAISAEIATDLGLDPLTVEGITVAATIHDVGKVGVPAEILARPGKLSAVEWEMMKIHPQVGHDIIDPIEFPWPIAEMILQHHERLDGSGYPFGLRNDEISLGARVIAVADVLEAMSSHRPYRPGLGIELAIEELTRGRGTQFDAQVVDTCLALCHDGRLATWLPADHSAGAHPPDAPTA
jgi:PAS domain S-box-containing protein